MRYQSNERKFVCDTCNETFRATVINGKTYAVNGNHTGKQTVLTELGKKVLQKCLECDAYSCDHQEINPETGMIER